MAARSRAAFKATKDSRYADNTSGAISEQDGRDMFEDVADSFLNITDDLLDEDDMASDSATKVPSQQSVKAYVDAQVGGISEATAGTYTPTISSTTNLDSSSVADVFNYVRIGDMVTVSGFLLLNPTTTDTLTELHLALPIASDFTTGYELGGIVNTTVSNDFVGGNASADTVNNNAYVSYKTKTAGSHSLFVQFTYKVVV